MWGSLANLAEQAGSLAKQAGIDSQLVSLSSCVHLAWCGINAMSELDDSLTPPLPPTPSAQLDPLPRFAPPAFLCCLLNPTPCPYLELGSQERACVSSFVAASRPVSAMARPPHRGAAAPPILSSAQDFARNQVGAQLNTLASSVLTLEPESEGHDDRHSHGQHRDNGHAADQWAAPDNDGRPTAGFESFGSDSAAEHHGGRHRRDGHHAANGSSTGGADFQDVSLDDAPPAMAAKALPPPRKGGAAAMAALCEENAVLKQRLAAVEAVSTAWHERP